MIFKFNFKKNELVNITKVDSLIVGDVLVKTENKQEYKIIRIEESLIHYESKDGEEFGFCNKVCVNSNYKKRRI